MFIMLVSCGKWLGCLCAKEEDSISPSNPSGNLTPSPAGQWQLSLTSPRRQAPARIPAEVGNAESAHCPRRRGRVRATDKEVSIGHDAVLSWLEKANDPSPSPDDDVAPVRKV